jgi:hypothetical protein
MRLTKPVDYTAVTQAFAKASCCICVPVKNAHAEQLPELSSIHDCTLGKSAEFLVSQRGMQFQEDKC